VEADTLGKRPLKGFANPVPTFNVVKLRPLLAPKL
jgi:hypothetical protein